MLKITHYYNDIQVGQTYTTPDKKEKEWQDMRSSVFDNADRYRGRGRVDIEETVTVRYSPSEALPNGATETIKYIETK